MFIKSMKLRTLGLAIAIALGVATSAGHGEITVMEAKKPLSPAADGKGPANELLNLSASLWVQCWQHGVKIIDEKDVSGIRLQNLIERDSLGFKGRNSNNGDIYVIPVNDNSTCLVKPLR
jgi:hypothetical protein